MSGPGESAAVSGRPRWARFLRRCAIALAALVLLSAIPIVWNEAACSSRMAPEAAPFKSQLDRKDHRDEVNTYLTYPEWFIVHAYEDLAGVMRQGSESDFGYFRSIRGYWSSLCGLYGMATSRGAVSYEYKQMLYVIGLSFTGEMAVKGLYEETIGAVTAWIRGQRPTAEDRFAQAVADDYAAFLRQTPWYEYPFLRKLRQFWAETSLTEGNPIRKLERRIALTLEWGTKSVYAGIIGFAAGLSDYPRTVRSVVDRFDAADVAADDEVKVVGMASGGGTILETPRYRKFTDIMRKLADRGRNFIEIAGNDDILVTVRAPARQLAGPAGTKAKELFAVPIQARPGWFRIGLALKVPDLTELMRRLEGTTVELEHVYDY